MWSGGWQMGDGRITFFRSPLFPKRTNFQSQVWYTLTLAVQMSPSTQQPVSGRGSGDDDEPDDW